MNRLTRRSTALILLTAVLIAGFPASSASAKVQPQRRQLAGWDLVPTILARIKAPKVPARDFPINDLGARTGSERDKNAAIRKAIEACHAAGGGRVVIPPGVFQTGAIHLKSNVNLHLSAGATLKFSANTHAYLPVVCTRFEATEHMNASPPIPVFEQEYIAVTGRGVLDGSASGR